MHDSRAIISTQPGVSVLVALRGQQGSVLTSGCNMKTPSVKWSVRWTLTCTSSLPTRNPLVRAARSHVLMLPFTVCFYYVIFMPRPLPPFLSLFLSLSHTLNTSIETNNRFFRSTVNSEPRHSTSKPHPVLSPSTFYFLSIDSETKQEPLAVSGFLC